MIIKSKKAVDFLTMLLNIHKENQKNTQGKSLFEDYDLKPIKTIRKYQDGTSEQVYDINDNALLNVTELVISQKVNSQKELDELNILLKDITPAIKKMINLRGVAVYIDTETGMPQQLIPSFYKALENKRIENAIFLGVCLSNATFNKSRLQDLKHLRLENTELHSFDNLLLLSNDCSMNIKNQHAPIKDDTYTKLAFVQAHSNNLNTDISELKDLQCLKENNEISLKTFIKYFDNIHYEAAINHKDALWIPFEKNNPLNIKITEKVTDDQMLFLQERNDYFYGNNFEFSGPLKEIIKINKLCDIEAPCRAIVPTFGAISMKDLQKNENIHKICIKNKTNLELQQEVYDRTTFMKLKSEVDKIIKETMPLFKTFLNEKQIFTRIYMELGKRISYDYETLKIEQTMGSEHNPKTNTSRNLVGGLLENTAVCAGYADILNAVCSELGIKSSIVYGNEKGKLYGHAWNIVRLDNKNYFTDLTWDSPNIQTNTFPLDFFLKSTEEFGHQNYTEGRNITDDSANCNESVTEIEQYRLIQEYKHKSIADILSDKFDLLTNTFKKYKSINKEEPNIWDEIENITTLEKGDHDDYEKDY